MIQISKLVFNAFQVNTYLLWDETGDCVVVDPACYDQEECKILSDFISDRKLNLVRNISTHCHIDHVLGNDFVEREYGIRPEYHRAGEPFFEVLNEIGKSFGYTLERIPEPAGYLEDNGEVRWGNSYLKVLYTPGHAEGSVCFYSPEQEFVITGDVLFKDTIGRTDLPSGDFDQLMSSIRNRLFTLPDATVAHPGHGPETTIGYEKLNNPFIR
jgi:glyoxylase-like metal-dependent hydrolase (beta-lactamase superfamily II)